jgi:hypothetical protein
MLITVLAATLLTYTSEQCGFSFQYPSTWKAVANPAAKVEDPQRYDTLATCAVGLRPRNWRDEMREHGFELHAYPVRVTKWNKGFLKAARESFFYKAEDRNGWRMISRGPEMRAEEFRTACCQGLRASSWSRIWTKKTHEVGSLSWEGALVNDRKGHTVIIESDHDERFHPVVTQIIQSVRFHSPRKAP